MPRIAIVTGLLLALLASLASAQYTAPRVPLGILVTNWDCAPCAPANQNLDAWYPTVGDDYALIRVHCWWPGPDDPIYRDNVVQSEYLIWDTPNGPDSAPHLWVDNIVNGGTYAEPMVGYLEDRRRVPAPLTLSLAWDAASQRCGVVVDVVNQMPSSDYRLFVAVTEDSVAAQGSNGEPYHNQAFRHLYPDTAGVVVTPDLGEHAFTVDTPLDSRWRAEQLRLTAYVQDRQTGEVQNAGTIRLADQVTAVPSEFTALAPSLVALPNPFNPRTSLTLDLPRRGHVRLRIHDLAGRLVRTLLDDTRPAGRHAVVWDGADEQGRAVPSGVYLARIQVDRDSAVEKLVLAR